MFAEDGIKKNTKDYKKANQENLNRQYRNKMHKNILLK